MGRRLLAAVTAGLLTVGLVSAFVPAAQADEQPTVGPAAATAAPTATASPTATSEPPAPAATAAPADAPPAPDAPAAPAAAAPGAATASVAGTAIDTVHRLSTGLTVFVLPAPGNPVTHNFQAPVAADGSYLVTGLPAGTFSVSFSGTDYSRSGSFSQALGATTAHPEGVTTTVRAGDTLTLPTETILLQGYINGFVECDDCVLGSTAQIGGQAWDPKAKAWVDTRAPVLTYSSVDPRIVYTLERMLPGTYRLIVTYSGRAGFDDLVTPSFVLAPGGSNSQTLALTRHPTSATGVSAPVSAFLTSLYEDFLNRRPSASDVSWWAKSLATGSPRGSVSSGFVDSDEYRLIRIDAAYENILGRASEPAGRSNWLTGMRAGVLTTDDIERTFYASDEFYNRSGGTNYSLVNGLYQQILGRQATGSEQLEWVQSEFDWERSQPPAPGQIFGPWPTAASFNRPWLINQIFGSLEAARNRVTAMYSHYLDRVPDDAGVQNWAVYDLAVGDAVVRAGLTGSDEYYALASTRYAGR